MYCSKDVLFMNVHLSKNAELFYKALEDTWVAEQSWFTSPNIAAWSCAQAVEKTIKGYLRCVNLDYSQDHQLASLMEDVLSVMELTPESKKYVLYLDEYRSNLRYKHMATDPTPEDARIAIARVKHIMNEFNNSTVVSKFISEAKEVHTKILKSSYEKYSMVDISNDNPEG